MAKALPALLGVQFKNQTGEHRAIILEDRGLFWKVRDDEDEEYQVKKTSVTRQFDAAELEPAPAPAPTLSASLAGLLNAAPAPTPAPATKKAEKDPDIVTLAELCVELRIVGRIARRRLRKALGQVGTGSRWEWKKASEELAKVRSLLSSPDPAAVDPLAEALDALHGDAE
jgi:hypothetical protein